MHIPLPFEPPSRLLPHLTLMETYITICKIGIQGEFAVWLRKFKQGLCINLDGWDGEGDEKEVQEGGTYVYLWLIHVEV